MHGVEASGHAYMNEKDVLSEFWSLRLSGGEKKDRGDVYTWTKTERRQRR